MKAFSSLFLLNCLPLVTASTSTPSSSSNEALRVPSWGILEIPRGGGASPKEANLPFDIDAVASILGAAKNVFVDDIAPVLTRESKKGLKTAKTFLKKQKKDAAKRRALYRKQAKDLSTTASTIVDPIRALKLTTSALVLAEGLNFIDGESKYLDDLSGNAKLAASDIGAKFDTFVKAGREPGGLLRGNTWTSRQKWFAAIQKQVAPKYQWAMGAAVGFVISPIVWTFGWATLGGTMVALVVAESHHSAKKHFPRYFDFLKGTNNQVIFVIDGLLEDLRELVDSIIEQPKATLFAIREELDERVDLGFEFPPEIQRGLLFGATVGVVAGI